MAGLNKVGGFESMREQVTSNNTYEKPVTEIRVTF